MEKCKTDRHATCTIELSLWRALKPPFMDYGCKTLFQVLELSTELLKIYYDKSQ